MNDTELETLLRSLTPGAPSRELAARVQHDMELMAAFRDAAPAGTAAETGRRQAPHWLASVVWAGLGAAAAVVVMTFSQHSVTASNTPSLAVSASPAVGAAGAVVPVSSTREWVDVEDLGISFATPGSPARQMKVVSMERHQWIDPRDGAEYTVEVPQEESVTVPIQYQ